MTMPPPVPALLRELLLSDAPVTLLKRVVISPRLVAGQFVAATPKGAAMYGYQDPQAFAGVWQSKTQHLAHYKQSFAIAIARHFEHKELPREYITTIVKPNGEEELVVKRTQELCWEG